MTDYKAMTPGDFLSAVGMSGEKWNEAYWQIWPNGCDDRETMFGWFCNAIMAGYDHAERKSEAARTALPGLVERVEAQQKAFADLVGSVLCARTSNTREYMAGLADDINAAAAVFGDPDRVAFERDSFCIIRAALKGDQA